MTESSAVRQQPASASKIWEQWYPLILAAGGTLVYVAIFKNRQSPSTMKDLYAALLTLGGTAMGFLATAFTILISVEDTHVVKQLRLAGSYDDLLKFLVAAIWSALAMSAWCLVGILFYGFRASFEYWWLIALAGRLLFVFTCFYTGFLVLRIVQLFFMVLNGTRVKNP